MNALKELEKRIERASSPYTRNDFESDLRQLLTQLGACCDARGQRFGQILVDRALGSLETSDAVPLLIDPSIIGANDQLAMRALTYAAKFSVKLSGHRHRDFRTGALAIAETLGDVNAQCVILINWAFAALAEDQADEAELMLSRAVLLAEKALAVQVDLDKSCEMRARLMSHEAKVRLHRARAADSASLDSSVVSAIGDYHAAIHLVRAQVHVRVNLQIELAQTLTELARAREELAEAPIWSALGDAERALDDHVCNECRAYFDTTCANAHELACERRHNHAPKEARAQLELARDALLRAIDRYGQTGHHFLYEAEARLERVQVELQRMNKPKKVFLSHASVDKPRVAQFADTLRTLGFDPWLDERELHAGARLERDLVEGLASSCAAVFFVTKSFQDDRFLRTEIDHSLFAYRRDPDEFKLIAILLDDGVDIPPTLGPYVCKRASNDLEVLQRILEALPIRVGTVTWRLPSA